VFNIVIFNKCNLSCEYCFAETYMADTAPKYDSNMMDLSIYSNILEFLKASNVNYISLLGGEPTLHPQFKQFVDLARAQGIRPSIKTNALFIKSVDELFGDIKPGALHFLINLNTPASMGEKKWLKTIDNLKALSKRGFNVDFQINIDREKFQYDYLWEPLSWFKDARLYWTFTVPIHNPKSHNMAIDPFSAKRKMIPRVMEMLSACKEKDIKTFGTHGITPCLFPKGFLEENQDNHRLGSNCVPVFDFYPDNSIHYCFPLEGHNSISDFNQFNNLQEIQAHFLWKASCARPYLFPWKECIGCNFAANGTCHGGCMSNKPWLKDTFSKRYEDGFYLNFVPALTDKKESIYPKFPNIGWDKQLKKDLFLMHPQIWKDFILLIDESKKLSTIKEELENKYEKNLSQWIQVCVYNLIGSLDLVFLPESHELMREHV